MPRFSSHKKKTDIQRKKTREFETPKQTMTLSSLSLSLSRRDQIHYRRHNFSGSCHRENIFVFISSGIFLPGGVDLRCCCGIIYGMMMIVIERASERSSHCHGVKELIRIHISAVLRRKWQNSSSSLSITS